jgi:hemolysin activation/secretion protein
MRPHLFFFLFLLLITHELISVETQMIKDDVTNCSDLSQECEKWGLTWRTVSSESTPLKGILFLGNWNQVRKAPRATEGVRVDHVSLLSRHQKFLKQIEEKYIGHSLTKEVIESIQADITSFYEEKKQPFVVVSIPRQEMHTGVLQIVVQEAKLGKITTRGNQYYAPSQLQQWIEIKPGETIDVETLVADLTKLNINPFRRTDAVIRPGQKPGIIDLELDTIDRWPYRFYTGGDNTGTESTDRDRLFFGFNFGKTLIQDSEIYLRSQLESFLCPHSFLPDCLAEKTDHSPLWWL